MGIRHPSPAKSSGWCSGGIIAKMNGNVAAGDPTRVITCCIGELFVDLPLVCKDPDRAGYKGCSWGYCILVPATVVCSGPHHK